MTKLREYLWITPFLGFIVGYCFTAYWYQNEKITIPPLVGYTLDQAAHIVSHSNLGIRIIEHKEDDHLPQATIIEQIPMAGSYVKENQLIFLTLSKKAEKPIAPAVLRHSVASIIQQCKERGITVKAKYIPHSYPHGTCFAQYPNAGHVMKETHLTVYVSDGDQDEYIIWPSFIGQSIDIVYDFFESLQINPHIVYKDKMTKNIGIVTSQRPLAGSIIKKNTIEHLSVQLYVERINTY